MRIFSLSSKFKSFSARVHVNGRRFRNEIFPTRISNTKGRHLQIHNNLNVCSHNEDTVVISHRLMYTPQIGAMFVLDK